MSALFFTTGVLSSLNVKPNPVVSLNSKVPHQFSARKDRDNLTGASLTIRGSDVRFQFNTSSRGAQIDNLTGARIGRSSVNVNRQSQFGSNLQVADFNDDGVDDLAVTAPNSGRSGQTFIYLGTANGLVLSEVLDRAAPGVNNVVGSGDFNGDGLDDLALGDSDSGLDGQVFVTFASSNGLSNTQILEP